MIQDPDRLLDLNTLSDASRELALSAAVRERFRPSQLIADWLERHGANIPDETLQEAMDVTLTLGALGGGGAERPEGTSLPLALRREILGAAALGETRQALARKSEPTRTEQRFADLMAGIKPDLEGMGRGDLQTLATAATWAHGLGGVPHIDPDSVSRRIADQEFLERVGGTDLNIFVGRKDLLQTLTRIWDLDKRPTVLIEGPGGIGKSLAVARFFQMLLKDTGTGTRPDAILHLDFDLPNMQRATAFDMSVEIVRQLAARWSTADQRSALKAMLPTLRGNDTTRMVSQSVESRDYRAHTDPEDILAKALHLLGLPQGRPLRLILFADSFERAELLDEVAARNVARVATALKSAQTDLMVIYAARAYLAPDRLNNDTRLAHQAISRFSQNEAMDYLIVLAAQRGFEVTRRMASRANRVIRGWPLGLRIAVSMLGTSPETFSGEEWLKEIECGGRSVQATLYERLLNRIEDQDLRKLAKPGLMVRRITPDVITHVLAGPCGLAPGFNARSLMDSAEREGQLFWRDHDDPGALWHRQDLREIMLPVLRIDVPDDTTRAIHDAAVNYYAELDSDIASAEEIYHRLWRGDTRAQISGRWRASAGQRLVGALDEMPKEAAAMLRLLLGGGRSGAATNDLEELRAVAQNRLSEGVSDLTDIFEAANVAQSIASPLGDVYASKLAHERKFDELLESIVILPKDPFISAPVKARMAMTAAAVAEGVGDLTFALKLWREAYKRANTLSRMEQLTLRLALARVPRRIGSGTQARYNHVLAACILMKDESKTLTTQRVTSLEAVAELSELMQPSRDWHKRKPLDTRETLLQLFRGLRPMFPSAMEDTQRLHELAAILRLPPNEVHRPSDLDSFMHHAFNNEDPYLHLCAVAALRSEVDAAFALAVGLDLKGRPDAEGSALMTY